MIVIWYVLFYLLTLLSNLLIYTFLKLSSYICKFCFYVLMNYSKTTNCFSLCAECISIPLPCNHLLIICISAKSAPQILSLKDEFILRFSNVLITSLCSFPANCSFPKTISTTVWVESLADLFAFPTSYFFIKKCKNHWSKSTFISILVWIFSNIKSLIS